MLKITFLGENQSYYYLLMNLFEERLYRKNINNNNIYTIK